MKKWFSENWFKLGILIAVIVVAWAFINYLQAATSAIEPRGILPRL